jgi:hypothetical protein
LRRLRQLMQPIALGARLGFVRATRDTSEGYMKADRLKTGFADRITAQQEAKKALLAKLKTKPHVPDPDFVSREQRKEEEREAVRRARAEAKEAARLAALESEEAKRKAAEEAEAAEEELRRSMRKERKALTKAEQKAKRDARYAARKARK